MRRNPVIGCFNHLLHNGHHHTPTPLSSSHFHTNYFNSLKRYMRSGDDGDGKPPRAKVFMEERAPSIVETIKRLEEDEEEEEREKSGIGSQTVDGAKDAGEEAVLGDSLIPESIKGQDSQASSSEEDE